jgi:hypothetical protein
MTDQEGERLIESTLDHPQRVRSAKLGKRLNLSAADWKTLCPRTIAPVDSAPR